jgi:hypothetical protein
MPIFTVKFTDNTIFEGGNSLNNSKWNDIPNKDILCLEYFVDDNSSIVLSGFEEYNHLVEVTQNVYGPKGTNLQRKLENIYLMGRKGDKITSYRISLKGDSGSDKYHKGDITKRISDLGKEFRGKPTINWKKGIK